MNVFFHSVIILIACYFLSIKSERLLQFVLTGESPLPELSRRSFSCDALNGTSLSPLNGELCWKPPRSVPFHRLWIHNMVRKFDRNSRVELFISSKVNGNTKLILQTSDIKESRSIVFTTEE